MPKGMQKMLKQAQQMQAQMLRAQAKLKETEIEGSAGGGMVKVRMSGGHDVLGVSIAREVVNPEEVEMLEDLVMAAFKNAQEKVSALTESEFGGLTSGLSLPGF